MNFEILELGMTEKNGEDERELRFGNIRGERERREREERERGGEL